MSWIMHDDNVDTLLLCKWVLNDILMLSTPYLWQKLAMVVKLDAHLLNKLPNLGNTK
jgi:hypothetical protein